MEYTYQALPIYMESNPKVVLEICKKLNLKSKTEVPARKKENKELNQPWWCLPIMPAAWETKAGGSQVQVQPGQLSKTLSQN